MILAIYLAVACAGGEPKADILELPVIEKPEQKKEKPTAKKESLLTEIEIKYTGTPGFTSKVKKTLKLKLLDQTRKQEGRLLIKKPGMFRLELEGEEKSLALTDGQTVWVVSYPTDPDFDNTVRVLRSRNPKKVQSQTLLAFIMGQGGLLKHYKVKSQKESEGIKTFELESKDKSEDVNKVTMDVSVKKKEIVSLRYSDKLQNLTTIEFSETQFDQELPTKDFKYSAPKGAEVTDI